jgi:Family of unknown function (DUF6012)
MLLHIRPQILSSYHVALIDLEVDPLGLHLAGGVDLATRRPYPNKRYSVACRKLGHKAIDGILIETSARLDELDTTARWAVEASLVVTHRVHYKLLDHDFDAASDLTLLWYACSGELGAWSDRWPGGVENRNNPRIKYEPLMELERCPCQQERLSKDIIDVRTGWIIAREETFFMPTIERERIIETKLCERIPALSAAFVLSL